MKKNYFAPAARKAWGFACVAMLTIAVQTVAQDTIPPVKDQSVQLFPAQGLGAVSYIEAGSFNKGFIHNPLQLVQGRVAGLLVAKPGGDPNGYFHSRLRGLHTLNEGYAEPLIVVDGFPQASLLSIDPEDIASFTILKDAASAARYGLRGASGVILIETRKAQEPGLRVRYRGAVSLETAAQKPDMLNASEYRDIYSNPNSPFFNPSLDLQSSTDWIGEITRNGIGHWHQIDVGYGGKKGSYRFAMHFRDANGIVRNSGYEQLNGHFSANRRLWKDRINIGADLGYTRRNARHIVPDVIRQAIAFNPTAPVRSDTALSTGGYAQILAFRMANPVALLEQPISESRQDVATANLHGSWQILPDLHFSGRFAVQQHDGLRGFATPANEYVFGLISNGFAQRYTDKTLNLFGEAALNYSAAIGNNRLNLSGGLSRQSLIFETENIEGRNWLIPDFSYEDLRFEGRYLSGVRQTRKDEHLLAGFWGSAQWEMQNGLQFAATLRREGSSRLGRDGRWAMLPALHAAWDMRSFLNTDTWDALRLRGSYGWAGNAPQSSYLSVLNWSTVDWYFYYDGEYVPYYTPAHFANPGLTRELRKEWNIGFDWALPDRRVFFSADYYNSRSEDLVRQVRLRSDIAGVGENEQRLYDNVGELRNAGLELNLGATLASKDGFHWTVSANAFYYRTRTGALNRLPYTPDAFTGYGFTGGVGSAADFVFRLEENTDLAELWAFQYEGIDEAGFWMFKDANRNGFVDSDDKRPVANALPSTAVGISSQVAWGRFDAQVFLRGLLGHSKVDITRTLTSSRITAPHLNLNREIYSEPLSRLRTFPSHSDFFVNNATFFRLDNVVLGYTLPVREGKWMSGWRFYAAAQNLLTFSGYGFNDPEPYLAVENAQFVPSTGVSRSRYGIPSLNNIQPGPAPESGTYFPSRVLVFGVEAKF